MHLDVLDTRGWLLILIKPRGYCENVVHNADHLTKEISAFHSLENVGPEKLLISPANGNT